MIFQTPWYIMRDNEIFDAIIGEKVPFLWRLLLNKHVSEIFHRFAKFDCFDGGRFHFNSGNTRDVLKSLAKRDEEHLIQYIVKIIDEIESKCFFDRFDKDGPLSRYAPKIYGLLFNLDHFYKNYVLEDYRLLHKERLSIVIGEMLTNPDCMIPFYVLKCSFAYYTMRGDPKSTRDRLDLAIAYYEGEF